MRWPNWLSANPPDATAQNDDTKEQARSPRSSNGSTSWSTNLNSTDWSQYTSPRAIVPSVILTGATLALLRLYKLHLRRIPTSDHIKPGFFRKRSLFGYVTSVGDGDNFRLFHTPGGRIAGWGWLPGRRRHLKGAKHVREKTIHVRIAGVDAPELAHFGRPAQPYGDEALVWLKSMVLGKYVRAYIYRRDQYERVVASVYVRNWLGVKQDLGLEMIKCGLATVYEAKSGSEFGTMEASYRAAQEKAKASGLGMWQGNKEPALLSKLLLGAKKEELETPRQYKSRMTATDKK